MIVWLLSLRVAKAVVLVLEVPSTVVDLLDLALEAGDPLVKDCRLRVLNRDPLLQRGLNLYVVLALRGPGAELDGRSPQIDAHAPVPIAP